MEEDGWDSRQVEWLHQVAQAGEWCDLAQGIDDNDLLSDQSMKEKTQYLHAGYIRELLSAKNIDLDPRGLRIRGAIIIGYLDLAHMSLPCRLEFSRCQFEKAPSFERTTVPELVLDHVSVPGMILNSIKVAGNIFTQNLSSHGEVNASHLNIEGELSFHDAKLSNSSGCALSLEGAVIGGGLNLDSATVVGSISASNINIGGNLFIREAKLTKRDQHVLLLDGANISGGVYLKKTEALGQIRAPGARVDGQFALTDANLVCTSENALLLDGAELAQGVYLNGTKVSGGIRAPGARIGLQLSLIDAQLKNDNDPALSLDRTSISGSMYLNGANMSGEIQAPGVQIDGKLEMKNTRLTSNTGRVLNLTGANLNQLTLSETNVLQGGIDLSFSTIRIFSVESLISSLPPLIDAQGWTLGIIHGFPLSNRKIVRAWLETIEKDSKLDQPTGFASQPWKELARIYDRVGQPEDAQWLRYQAARKVTKIAPLASKLMRIPYSILVGYGYYPRRAAYWIAALWLTVLVLCFINSSVFVPTSFDSSARTTTSPYANTDNMQTGAEAPMPDNYPQFSPFLFAVDTAIPTAASGQAEAWHISGNMFLVIFFTVIKGFSWILSALFLAGITGLLRRD